MANRTIDLDLASWEYNRFRPRWEFVRDCYVGSDEIKRGPNSTKYLPPNPIERAEMNDRKRSSAARYEFRRKIASFENYFKPTIDDVSGLLQKNPPIVKFGVAADEESPTEVRAIQWFGNSFNDGVRGLKNRVNFAQTLYGRCALLLDVVADENGLDPRFCIAEYDAFHLLDGETIKERPDAPAKLKWALLDETSRKFDRRSKRWAPIQRLRVVGLDADGRYYNAVLEGSAVAGDWIQFDLDYPQGANVVYPTFKGATLSFVPITVCNVDRLGIDVWQEPPYLDVAEISVGAYVVDSWHKQALYHCATPTLAICDAARTDSDVRLGSVLWLSGKTNNAARAAILETSGAGLAEMRAAKEAMKEALKYSSIRELLDGAGANSSGEAIKLRTAAGTAAPAAIDQAGARAIEEQLVFAAIWAGATQREASERITFDADVSYLGTECQLQSVVALLQTNSQTKTLSNANVYAALQKAIPGVFSSFDDNESQKLVDEESALDEDASFDSSFFSNDGGDNDDDNNDDADDEENFQGKKQKDDDNDVDSTDSTQKKRIRKR